MKKIMVFIMVLSMVQSSNGQEDQKQKEFGIAFSGLNSFGLVFKCGKESAMWRFNALSGSIGDQKDQNPDADSLFNQNSNLYFSFSVGREWRKNIVDKLECRMGADLGFSYNYTLQERREDRGNGLIRYYNERTTYSPSIAFVLGLNYVIKNALVIGAEIRPRLSYTAGEEKSSDNYTTLNEELNTKDITAYYFGFSNGSALITISYRFLK